MLVHCLTFTVVPVCLPVALAAMFVFFRGPPYYPGLQHGYWQHWPNPPGSVPEGRIETLGRFNVNEWRSYCSEDMRLRDT